MQFTESQLEQAIIELFSEQGYAYQNGATLPENTLLLNDELRAFLAKRYQAERLTAVEIDKIINRLALIPDTPLYDGNKAVFELINAGFDFVRDDNQGAVHIDFIDFALPENNAFKVVNQLTVHGKHTRRPDVLLYINGIPLVILEFKSAISENTTIFDAWEQIAKRYVRDIPSLLKFTPLAVISDGANSKMGSPFTPYAYFYAWHKINEQDSIKNGISALIALIQGALSKERLLALLQDFVFFPDNGADKQSVIVARYPQFFAATKMLANIKQHLRPHGDGKGGTYFGATGCGKTYTMLYLARLLVRHHRDVFRNPTVIILTDREDLDSQTGKIFVQAKGFLGESNVCNIESRQDLADSLKNRPSGGIYLTTIQKFAESTGLLSDRHNIICISDEAHRTQVGVGSSLALTEQGAITKYGFAKYLRDAFPNATYCGFTGTPIDETLAVFGDVVDKYTMKQASDDGITVRIAYEPRLARVLLSEQKAKEIEQFYQDCLTQGSQPEQVERSKKQMSQMRQILGNPERLAKIAQDLTAHYDAFTTENPQVVKKAMIVCADRQLAYELLQQILAIKPQWGIKKRAENEDSLPENELAKLVPLPKINLVATRGENDSPELYECCGTKEYRKQLDRQFKNDRSNFQIAIVVDMWITGFDVPSLAVMYIDKPLQKHTLIQTISRVNRVYDGKSQGLVVDYIGIRDEMLKAVKTYGDDDASPVDNIAVSLDICRNLLALLAGFFVNFNRQDFFTGSPLARLHCLNLAAEHIQSSKETEQRFMLLSRQLKSAYEICAPTGELSDEQISHAQFYLAVRSIIYKQNKGNAPDSEAMNSVVADMVLAAISVSGVENIVNAAEPERLFDEAFEQALNEIKLPISKYHALLKLLKQKIRQYSQTNKLKAIEFDERLKKVVEQYNSRDNLTFTNQVVADFVDELSDELLRLLKELEADQHSFERMGISMQEKAFYDILVKVRDEHQFQYADEKCLILAKKIKELIDDKQKFADWHNRADIKNQLNENLTILLYENGYPPEWDEEIFEKIMEQTENLKRYDVD